MKMMIALRRVSTPITPIENSTALKKSDSVSTDTLLALAEHHRADDGGEQQHARHLEGQEVFVEEGAGEGRDGPAAGELSRQRILRQPERFRHARLRDREHLREQRKADRAGHELPAKAASVGELGR